MVKLVQDALKEPEHTGSYDEYIELCKLYDKNENGTMMLAELENFLSNLGISVLLLTYTMHITDIKNPRGIYFHIFPNNHLGRVLDFFGKVLNFD